MTAAVHRIDATSPRASAREAVRSEGSRLVNVDGRSNVAIGRLIDMTPQYVGRLRAGLQTPSLRLALVIEAVLHISPRAWFDPPQIEPPRFGAEPEDESSSR